MLKKIMVIGSSGSGKSTFSRQLQNTLNLPLYHLDRLFWRPHWKESNKIEFRERVSTLARKDRWIIDGNYGRTIDVRAKEADMIIFLDPPRLLCLYRAFKRFLNGMVFDVARPDITEKCKERMNWQFFRWIWTYPYQGKKRALTQIQRAGFPLQRIIWIRSKKDTELLFKTIKK